MVKKIEGKKCPDFKGESTSGLTLSNKDFVGKNLVIYFYPKDSTPAVSYTHLTLPTTGIV